VFPTKAFAGAAVGGRAQFKFFVSEKYRVTAALGLRKNAARLSELGYATRAVKPMKSRFSTLLSATIGLAGLATVAGTQACSGTATDTAASGGTAPAGGSQGASGGAGAGGGAAGGAAPAGGGAGCDIPKILNLNCAASTCHGTANKPPMTTDLNLFVADLESVLLNKPATYKGVDKSTAANPTACPSPAQLLVDPAGLETSLMWMKVAKTHSCGDEMPNGITFDATETGCYKAWLEEMIAKAPK
jgi:hypothetical protein